MWRNTFYHRLFQLIWDCHSLEAIMGHVQHQSCTVAFGREGGLLSEEGWGKLGLLALSASPCELGGFKIAACLKPSELIRSVYSPVSPKILILLKLEIREIIESEVIF